MKNKKKTSKSVDNITYMLYNCSADGQQNGAIRKNDDFRKIYEHKKFRDEFEETVLEKGEDGQYHRWLRKSLEYLEEKEYSAMNHPHFETIKESAFKIKSLRYPNTQRNPRVLFCFQGNAIILLHCFRESSKSEGSEYKKALKIATGRLLEIQGN